MDHRHAAQDPGRTSFAGNARRTADLVNVLSGDLPPGPAEVAAVLVRHGEPEPVELDGAGVAAMRRAAGALREVFTAGSAGEAVAVLNALLGEHAGPLRLTSHGGTTGWHPHVDRDDDGPWDAWLLTSSCLALAVLVWERQRQPGGVCASPACGNVFVTLAGGPERRYCSRRCATRERVAAHRRRGAG